ncbi:hypothetical protein [Stenotrophomonas sp. GD03657]|uniref:hypothetical protein n=1 Tax=Stenotrophomonas sp. GD03657 TaxID=2975363 RepID=UPI00244C2E4F|nr:hypothetical protein [Stenotrophomonas sp. GD03657]MDH2154291.1 hypothetical protein [Stenotrophomonas sp. GD03657]
MNPIINGSPQATFTGFDDKSGRPPVYVPESVPTHLPHVFFYAQKGGDKPFLGSGDAFTQRFGSKTLDPRSKYFNHASYLASTVMGRGNAIMGQRIIPADAPPPARLLLSVDYVKDEIQQYQRDADKKFLRSTTGELIPVTGAGAKIPGHKLKWVRNQWAGINGDETFAAVTSKTGSLMSGAGIQSNVLPIIEFEAAWQGSYGDNQGLRIDVPTNESLAPVNSTLVEATKSMLYRFQIVERADAESSAQPVASNNGDSSLDLSLKDGVVNPATTARVSVKDRFLQSYQTLGQRGFADRYGPFGRVHIYKANLEKLLREIAADEVEYGTLYAQVEAEIEEWLYTVNPFTGVNIDNVPYYSVQVLSARDGGLNFTGTTNHWSAGGGDGTMNDVDFDKAVRDQLTGYGTNGIDMLDKAMYPQSCWYDSGFSLDTKMAAMTILGRREDMWIVLSTQDVTQPQNLAADESAMAVALSTALRVYPESEIFGTAVCRALVVGHSGYLIDDSGYAGLLPLTIELADRCANYMGAANGVWRPGLGFDVSPNNQITLFNANSVNATFKSAAVRNKDWDNNLVWAQRFDRASLFWPAVQTVYNDDTSVLNGPITMFAAVELTKVCFRVWAELTGRSDLTEEQLIERSDNRILQLTNGRFDNRFVIEPETFFTDDDRQRGYSWQTKVNLYANNMRTVGTYTIVARRMSDLSESAT